MQLQGSVACEGASHILRDCSWASLGSGVCDFRIGRLRFACTRLRFAWVSPGVVCGADPGSGLY
jgi:hypothetical protein